MIVGTEAVAGAARRLLHLRRDRIRVVPLAPRPAFALPAAGGAAATASAAGGRAPTRAERERLGLPERYLVYSGPLRRPPGPRDAARGARAGSPRPADPTASRATSPWPPRVLLVGASPGRSGGARPGRRAGQGVGERLAYAPGAAGERLGRASSAAPGRRSCRSLSDAAGLAALEAIACGTPVVASAVGALPEIVGAAGILVEPRDPDRLAAALATALDATTASTDGSPPPRASGPRRDRRTWADVAPRRAGVYAEVGRRAGAARRARSR